MALFNIQKRSQLLQDVFQFDDSGVARSFTKHLDREEGNADRASTSWENDPSVPPLTDRLNTAVKLGFAAQLASISDDNVTFVKAVVQQQPTSASSLRAFALGTSFQSLSNLLPSTTPSLELKSSSTTAHTPTSTPGDATPLKTALHIRRKLFLAEPTGVVMRMLKDNEIPLDPATQGHIYDLLDEQPDFSLRNASASSLLNKSTLFRKLSTKTRAAVASDFRVLQRVQALSSVPEAIGPLIKRNLTSALHISNIAEAAFVQQLQPEIGDQDVAISIHRHAVNSRIRNENFLISSMQTVRGSGLRVIDGGNARTLVETRKSSFNSAANQAVTQVNLEELFGSLDFCDCSECGSVYGAASYFVELMEFLRNNNLSLKNSKSGVKDVKGTQLEALLKRRPDLACLKLTCENTNTLIPYIDLALEVMESYVVHAPTITTYNVNGETSSELLCSPQHTDLSAYEILRTSVYPLGLPYNFAIDIMRVFLQFLRTSRAEILQVFQNVGPDSSGSGPSAEALATASRAYDAEYNLMTQEEYVILTQEAFHPPPQSSDAKKLSEYQRKIGIQDPWKYFNYSTEPEMLDDDPATMTGLSWVKAQFVKRTGIQYTDLVGLLQTQYINPNYPSGQALATMQRIKFSYRFLQYLVYNQYSDKRRKYSRLIKFLHLADEILPLLDKLIPNPAGDLCSDPNSVECCCPEEPPPHQRCCCGTDEWTTWVYDWFEKIGSIIVLESGEGPRIPLEGRVWSEVVQEDGVRATKIQSTSSSGTTGNCFIGTLGTDGAIINDNKNAVGFVANNGMLVGIDGKPLQDPNSANQISVYANDSDVGNFIALLGYVDSEGLLLYKPRHSREFRPVEWSSARDDCDITKTRLLHLDGSQLSSAEYLNMARFLRLWRKLGWTIDEIDEVIAGLGKPTAATEPGTQPSSNENCESSDDDDGQDDGTQSSNSSADIIPELIHQLVSVQKLLDLTGLSLEIVLTFWDTIPTHGDQSLYATTFLTHNMVSLDPIFQADTNGNYLTGQAKISDHLTILQTALRLKLVDIQVIQQLRNIPDLLTIDTLSEFYRISTLLRYLSVRSALLPDVIAVLDEPFTNADITLAFIQNWQKIKDSNFSFQQLNYLFRGVDNVSSPLAPTPQTVLKLSKALLDGLAPIQKQNTDVSQADIDSKTISLSDLIPTKLILIFDPTLAGKINNLLNGRASFTTNAPSGLTLVLTGSLTAKVKYVDQPTAKPPTAQLTITGILTDDESASLKALSSHELWPPAVDRIKKQGVTFYNQYLASIFPADGQAAILAGDTAETPVAKSLYFLKYFLPFLRGRLSTAMIQQTISDSMGIDPRTTSYLLTIVKSSGGDTALNVLLSLSSSQPQPGSTSAWTGYLIPTSTDMFQFWTTSDTPPPGFKLNGAPYSFPHQSEDPSNIWSSDWISLVAGTLYLLELTGTDPSSLSWSTATSPSTTIPSSALLPALSSASVSDVLVGLTKISLVIQGFSFSLDEVMYFHDHGMDFASILDSKPLDLGALTLGTWLRLLSYSTLRDSIPKQPTRLIDLFAWSRFPGQTDVVGEVVKVTQWDATLIPAVLTGYNALKPDSFHNELTLIKLKQALDVVKKTQIPVPTLFEWAKPLGLSDKAYRKLLSQAELLKKTLRSRYLASDWEQAAKSLFDTLRKNQRNALVAYLVVERSLVATGLVQDADGLFEYFLIDCQMSACLQTSRIKQAISTIQLYVQRCLLGLEAEIGTKDDLIDRNRWTWMKRYRVWEANRQVYLYPENWIVPSLRDDKTPFFLDFESALQQRDISMKTAAATLKSYIFNLAAVANLKVYGLYVQKSDSNATAFGIHIVARRMNAPYDWYSRDRSSDGTWSPWVKMPVDIPNYDAKDSSGNPVGSGSLIAPFLWQGRPIIFFLHLLLKHKSVDDNQKLSDRWGQDAKAQIRSRDYYQINLGVSRYDNGKWAPKELSQSYMEHFADEMDITDNGATVKTYPSLNLARYQISPRLISDSSTTGPDHIQVDILYTEDEKDIAGDTKHWNNKVGHFIFVDGGISQQVVGADIATALDQVTTFHYDSKNTIYPYQVDGNSATITYFSKNPNATYPTDVKSGTRSTLTVDNSTSFILNHSFVDSLMKQTNATDDLSLIYQDFATLSASADGTIDNPFGSITLSDGSHSYNELMSPYGIYNWELGLHAPMELIDGLLQAQQFDDALAVCHTIFDPSVVGSSSSSSGDNSQFWKFAPFKALANNDAKKSLEQLFLQLAPRTADQNISTWRDNPFAPHVVARMRPVAYMKWVAMKYIEILIAYGDYYFRQNSLETIPDAIQCYILASHVYGPRGQKIPRRGKIKPQTYNTLLNSWDAFGNAIVQLEVEFPFSNQTSQVIGSSNGITGIPNIYGFASSLYFCIPSNPQLAQLRDTIDDRLYKIRNCMDINGVFRRLPLFDPPIDPALLVAATAQGLSIDTVLSDLSGPIPNYRFETLLAKALEICNELKSLGAGLLSAKEKKDNEHIATLRASHETILTSFTLDMKNRALDEANSTLDQLVQSREGPKYRLQFWKSLVGLTDPAPEETDDFNEIPNPSMETPVGDGQMLLLPEEEEEISKSLAYQDWNTGIGIVEALAGVFHMFPDTEIDIKPFGVGTGLKWGGNFLGSSTGAVARGLQVYATTLSNSSSNAARKATFLRALQDRVMQANNSGRELKNIDAQIATQRLHVATAQQDIQNTQTQLHQVTQVEQYLRSKYTNEELYSWMESQTRTLYNATYNLAFDLAKRAETSLQFERPQLMTASFIELGYWTSARDGLLAGESLYLSLKRLEAAYHEDLGHDFEAVKHISVRQWAPLALLEFREQGSFILDVPEILFDMDYPGHFMRRITSVSVSIPCIAGPYTGVNCTLRLQSHSMRTSARATSKGDYPRQDADSGNPEDRFITTNVPISAVVLSSAQAENGRVENPPDRFSPFEGAGCISTWSFALPTAMRAFDYGSISDVVLTLRYTSLDGGDKLRDIASGVVGDYMKAVLDAGAPQGAGLFTFFDLRADFATEWFRAGFGTAATGTRTMTLASLSARLPLYAASTPPGRIVATRIAVLARGDSFSAGDVQIVQAVDQPGLAGVSVDFKPGASIGPLVGIVSADDGLQIPMTSWVLNVKQGSAGIGGLWMVVRYSLT